LGLPDNKPLILWTGYIQQIGKEDFLLAIKTAQESLKRGLDVVFYFAFKPESFEKKFSSFHNPAKGINVKPTVAEEFDSVKHCADILYSPIISKNCIIAPPLTWIEVMALGKPILTTDVGGACEIIQNGETGFIANSTEDLIEKMFDLVKIYPILKEKCIAKIKGKYNIDFTAAEYLRLFLNRTQ
jgi:glycosyltransferase involved in cell wall biosynthesis